MKELDTDQIFSPARKTLIQLTEVPVDVAFSKRFLAILARHGAQVTHTNTKQRTLAEGKVSTYHEYTIDFPAGTQREDGMMLYRSAPFTIYFPDGYELPGVEFTAMPTVSGKKPLIILHFPR